ncbi:MAG: AbrB/MazE/SpoVT family DNA-binding domain-containing protein [Oscillospiraceae bacterium]|nr:AbrB/MazE/SpoVT family DNA-binding domain-containing protein [Oscillospiraceae bacterium]
MTETLLVNDARVMSKGQVTIPKNIREVLGISVGDRVTFIVEDGSVKVMNSAIYAMKKFQEQMKGEAEKAGFVSEEEIAEWITESRHEDSAE